jgi:hypothetical protein
LEFHLDYIFLIHGKRFALWATRVSFKNLVSTVRKPLEEFVKRSNIPLLLEQIELLKVASNTKNEIIILLKKI